MADHCVCAHCGADLRGPAIAPEDLHYYGGEATCHGCGQPRHGSRLIAVVLVRLGRAVAWRCPDCGHEEDRRLRVVGEGVDRPARRRQAQALRTAVQLRQEAGGHLRPRAVAAAHGDRRAGERRGETVIHISTGSEIVVEGCVAKLNGSFGRAGAPDAPRTGRTNDPEALDGEQT